MTRLTVTLYGCNITSIKVVMLLQDLDNGNDRCWANGWLHGQGLALEGRLKAYPGRYEFCSQRYSNHHPQWYRTINATIVSKHQSELWKVLASVPVQDSALLEPLTSLGCAGDVIFVIVIVILGCSCHICHILTSLPLTLSVSTIMRPDNLIFRNKRQPGGCKLGGGGKTSMLHINMEIVVTSTITKSPNSRTIIAIMMTIIASISSISNKAIK